MGRNKEGHSQAVACREQRATASFRPQKEKNVASMWHVVVEKAVQKEQITEPMPPDSDSECEVYQIQGQLGTVCSDGLGVGFATDRLAIKNGNQ